MPETTGGMSNGFAPGVRVAGYVLQEQIGAGGMAVVFKAVDARLDRTVALKILAPALASDHEFRQRFVRESRAATAVDDPHIVPVYEADEADGVLFIAMRYVPGGSVSDLLHRQGPLPPGRVAAIISPIASALDAAHQIGLVHRDVKPANMLIDVRPDRPDHVYLSDFGLTKGGQTSVGLTGTNQVLGTPDYMAPEQIEGRAVTGRTDQYALACAAFEMLTGRSPFHREQGMAVLWAHLNQPVPPLGSVRPGLRPAADSVFARALAKVPAHRYGSCRDFADALRDAFDLAPYRVGSSIDQPASPQVTQDVRPGHEPTFAAYPPTRDVGLAAPPPLTDPPTEASPPPRRPAATPSPVRPALAQDRPPPSRRASRYPPVTNLASHFVVYLLPLLLPFYGMFFTLYLMSKRGRSVRMSAILGFEIGVIWNAGLLCGTGALSRTADTTLLVSLFVFCCLLALGLAVACLVQLCMRKQPRIPVLSDLAYRLAYGKARRRL